RHDSARANRHGGRLAPAAPATGDFVFNRKKPRPMATFMQQCARQLTDPFDGFLLGKRYLLHDRDTKCTQAFDASLKDSAMQSLLLPPRSPNVNAHCARFVRSIK